MLQKYTYQTRKVQPPSPQQPQQLITSTSTFYHLLFDNHHPYNLYLLTNLNHVPTDNLKQVPDDAVSDPT